MSVEFGRSTPGAPEIISGQTTVTTAGTEVRLSTDFISAIEVRIRALDANTGLVVIGNNGSDAVTTANGYQLLPQANDVPLVLRGTQDNPINLSHIWVDSAANSEGVSWVAVRAHIES